MLYCNSGHTVVTLLCAILLACMSSPAAGAAVRVVTQDELKAKNGKDSNEMWLSILGEVYDVSEGKQYYGEGSPYNIFLGRDASASFVTGNFTEAGAKESLLELDPPVKLTQLDDW
jgi:predicted heme/steroid binding protein